MPLDFSKISAVSLVVEREVLPSCVADNPATQGFISWCWHSFQPDPVSARLVGKVTATRLADNLIVWSNVTVWQDELERSTPAELFNLIDHKMKDAINYIVNYDPPHVAGALCRNNFCEECYK